MMNALLLLFVQQPLQINLTELGLYNPTGVPIIKIQDDFVIESGGKILVAFDEKGSKIGSYDKTGQAPDELESATILGTHKDTVIVQKNRKSLQVFDRHCQLKKSEYAPLPAEFQTVYTYGRALPDSRFLLAMRLNPGQRFGLRELRYDSKKGWQEVGTYLRKTHPMEHCTFSDDATFLYKPFLEPHEEEYSVKVFLSVPRVENWEDSVNLVLQREFSGDFEIIRQRYRAFLEVVAKTPSGYIVQLSAKQAQASKADSDIRFWDHFDAKGSFVKREKATGKYLTPVINSSEVFVITTEGDDDMLTKIF